MDEYKKTDLELEDITSENEDLEIDDAPYEIRTLGADFSLELYSQKITSEEIVVPPFQRKYVWPVKKASKLIESFLLGLPVPQVFLYQESSKRDLLVVDGQQRLISTHSFLTGEFADGTEFRLRGVKQKWEGKNFDELDEADKRRLRNYILRATIFEQIDPSDNKSVYEIFERLNTGGMPLTEQEVRNCVNRGKINGFLEDVNKDETWRKLLGKLDPDRRMKDIEIVLRVFALIEGWSSYKKSMKDYISAYMEANVDLSEEKQKELSSIFRAVTEKILIEVGPSAFRLKGGRVNVAILDSVITAVAIIGSNNITDLGQKLELLKTKPVYIDYISKSTTDDDSVKGRIKISIETFRE